MNDVTEKKSKKMATTLDTFTILAIFILVTGHKNTRLYRYGKEKKNLS